MSARRARPWRGPGRRQPRRGTTRPRRSRRRPQFAAQDGGAVEAQHDEGARLRAGSAPGPGRPGRRDDPGPRAGPPRRRPHRARPATPAARRHRLPGRPDPCGRPPPLQDASRRAAQGLRLRGAENPVVAGLVAAVGGREVYVPIEQVSSLDGDAVRLSSAKLRPAGVRAARRRGAAARRRVGHRLIDVESAHLIKAADLEIEQQGGDWVLTGVDTRRRARRFFGARPVNRVTTRSASGPGSSR